MLTGTEALLVAMLPEYLSKAINQYVSFAQNTAPSSHKDFAAHQSACKASLAHVDHLLKLAYWVENRRDGADAPPGDSDKDAAELITRAKLAIGTLEKNL